MLTRWDVQGASKVIQGVCQRGLWIVGVGITNKFSCFNNVCML